MDLITITQLLHAFFLNRNAFNCASMLFQPCTGYEEFNHFFFIKTV